MFGFAPCRFSTTIRYAVWDGTDSHWVTAMADLAPATVHFDGGPHDGTGESDGDERVNANMLARMTCFASRNGEKIPAGVPGILSDYGMEQARQQQIGIPLHSYRAIRAEHIDGRLHIFCEYQGVICERE